MKLFLTSSPGGNYKENGVYFPCAMDNRNQFVENLRAALPEKFNCLMIAAAPSEPEMNDSILRTIGGALSMSGIPAAQVKMCDDRNAEQLEEMLNEADFVILCGGHVPTQNEFFKRIGLKEKLAAFDGVVMGISAGTMNCATLVYAQPELDGEAIDPDYDRYIEGLGLTEIRILPHFQYLRELTLDGLRVLEDISLPDSRVQSFYALVDGSYILAEDGKSVLYGEAYYLADGKMVQISDEGEQHILPRHHGRN